MSTTKKRPNPPTVYSGWKTADQLGTAVALSGAGNRVEVTAPREDAPELNTGAALVFDLAI